jgi:hypothetical protein
MELAHAWSWRDPGALLRFVDQVLVFAERHLIWQVTRVWPGGQSAHGNEGYVEYVHEALGCSPERLANFAPAFAEHDEINPYAQCPCSSGKKYRFCHRQQVKTLRKECGCIGPAVFESFSRRRTPKAEGLRRDADDSGTGANDSSGAASVGGQGGT